MTREELRDALEQKLMGALDRLMTVDSAKLDALMEQALMNALGAEVQGQASRVVSGLFSSKAGFTPNGGRRRNGRRKSH